MQAGDAGNIATRRGFPIARLPLVCRARPM